MKKVISVLLCLVFVFSLAACGGGDAVKGTWTSQDADYGTITFEFDGKGKCSFSNDFFSGEGTYTLTETQMTIEGVWDDAKVYDFTVSDSSLKLTATDEISPSYDLTKK